MVALGSGGVTGVGLGDGRQKLGFLPNTTPTYFLDRRRGTRLVATLSVLLAFLVIMICGVYIAWSSRDTFGMLIASGITFSDRPAGGD